MVFTLYLHHMEYYCHISYKISFSPSQACSQQGCGEGGQCTTPNQPKGPLFATKWAKNGVLWGRLGPKGPLSEVPHSPKIESGYGPAPSVVLISSWNYEVEYPILYHIIHWICKFIYFFQLKLLSDLKILTCYFYDIFQ